MAALALWGVGGDRAAALAAEGGEVEYTLRPASEGRRTDVWLVPDLGPTKDTRRDDCHAQ
jgi:hypothetical protein